MTDAIVERVEDPFSYGIFDKVHDLKATDDPRSFPS